MWNLILVSMLLTWPEGSSDGQDFGAFDHGELEGQHLPVIWANFQFQEQPLQGVNLLITFYQKEELNLHSAKTKMPLLAWIFEQRQMNIAGSSVYQMTPPGSWRSILE